MKKIYVASSWRNRYQPAVVAILRQAGFEFYDFRHPFPGNDGFHWSEIDPNWKKWSVKEFAQALHHPIAESGFYTDLRALLDADAVVLVLPCGRSAHLEAGTKASVTYVYSLEPCESELMYRMCKMVTDKLSDIIYDLGGE